MTSDFREITVDSVKLNEEQKKQLYKLGFRGSTKFLLKLNYITKENYDTLHQIYDIRNTYSHLEEGGDAESHSITTLNRMCKVLVSLFDIFKFYDLRDGVLYPKEEYKGRVVEQKKEP